MESFIQENDRSFLFAQKERLRVNIDSQQKTAAQEVARYRNLDSADS